MTDEKECPDCGGKMILNEEHNETVCVDCVVEESDSQSNETGDNQNLLTILQLIQKSLKNFTLMTMILYIAFTKKRFTIIGQN